MKVEVKTETVFICLRQARTGSHKFLYNSLLELKNIVLQTLTRVLEVFNRVLECLIVYNYYGITY